LLDNKSKGRVVLTAKKKKLPFHWRLEPNARVIDSEANKIQFLKEKHHLFMGLLMGLLIPFGVIYTDDLWTQN
jgi:hypothetical protein